MDATRIPWMMHTPFGGPVLVYKMYVKESQVEHQLTGNVQLACLCGEEGFEVEGIDVGMEFGEERRKKRVVLDDEFDGRRAERKLMSAGSSSALVKRSGLLRWWMRPDSPSVPQAAAIVVETDAQG
jgi:hypothetical protein